MPSSNKVRKVTSENYPTEDGLFTRTTKERLEALEIQKDELTAKIADEKLKKPSFNEDFIRFWLLKLKSSIFRRKNSVKH